MEVQTHTEGHCRGTRYPAVNVKVKHFPSNRMLREEFGCSKHVAERAWRFWWDSAQWRFWHEDAQTMADEILPWNVEIFSAGRSAGWLIVQGTPPIDSWTQEEREAWEAFENACHDWIEDTCEPENVLEDVRANRWAEPGAEEYNFLDTEEGTVCLADLKAQAVEDGYGPVVRQYP